MPLVNAMYKQTEELSPRSPHFHRDHELDNPVFPTTAENTGTSIGGKGGQSPRKFRKMQSMKLGITRQVATYTVPLHPAVAPRLKSFDMCLWSHTPSHGSFPALL